MDGTPSKAVILQCSQSSNSNVWRDTGPPCTIPCFSTYRKEKSMDQTFLILPHIINNVSLASMLERIGLIKIQLKFVYMLCNHAIMPNLYYFVIYRRYVYIVFVYAYMYIMHSIYIVLCILANLYNFIYFCLPTFIDNKFVVSLYKRHLDVIFIISLTQHHCHYIQIVIRHYRIINHMNTWFLIVRLSDKPQPFMCSTIWH